MDESAQAWTPSDFEARLRAMGETRYHHRHPFHLLMNEGKLSQIQLQAWVLNRYYYQSSIPLKDAALIARCKDQKVRVEWLHRIIDHDGDDDREPGGIDRWLILGEALGLPRTLLLEEQGILPATRFAVDAYVRFVAQGTLLSAIASSLTELFSPQLIQTRVSAMLCHYDFLDEAALAYFSRRPLQAGRDSHFALAYVLEHARTPESQTDVLNALSFKCDVLWAQLDALYYAYVSPGFTPPGAFNP